jgi:Putative zinc-finger
LTCSDARERLSALLERPPAADAEPLRAHVEGCPGCRAELAALMATDEKVKGAVFALSEAAPPADYFDELAGRIDAKLDAPPARPPGATRMMVGLGAAAIMSGAIGVVLFIRLHEGPGSRIDALRRGPGGATRGETAAPAPPPAPPPTPVVESKAEPDDGRAAAPEKPADRPADEPEAQPKAAAKPSAAAPAPKPMRAADKGAAVETPKEEESAEGGGGAVSPPEVRACWEKHRQDGVVVARITVDADGRVTDVVSEGTLAATPSGACVAEAVRQTRYPEGAARTFRVTFSLHR